MDYKKLFLKIFASILGILIIGSLVNLIEVIILTIYLIIFRVESISDTFWILYPLISLFIVVAGIYFGLKCYKNKNIWYKVFKPNKAKAMISIILSVIVVTLSLSFYSGKSFVNAYTLKPVFISMAIPLTIISYFIAFYPFSALCNFVYEYRKDKLFKKSKIMIIILLVLLNPIFIVYSGAAGAIYRYGIINEPCGIKIIGFNEPSPAKESGIQLNEIILEMDNTQIKSIKDLEEYMANYDPSNDLIIKTNSNIYSVNPVFKDGRYLLGININQEMCKRSLRK